MLFAIYFQELYHSLSGFHTAALGSLGYVVLTCIPRKEWPVEKYRYRMELHAVVQSGIEAEIPKLLTVVGEYEVISLDCIPQVTNQRKAQQEDS